MDDPTDLSMPPTRNDSTRSCPSEMGEGAGAGGGPTAPPRRHQNVRRSLKEIRLDVARNLEPFVHRTKTPGLERICEEHSLERSAVPPAPSSERGSTVIERIESTLHENYYRIAYAIVIATYFIGFTEYAFLRLLSVLIPEKLPGGSEEKPAKVGKDGFHYAISIGAFIAIALFQIICFFGLTISERWIRYDPPSGRGLSGRDEDSVSVQLEMRKEEHRVQTAAHIRDVISRLMYRTFSCYAICSFIICVIIFYMVGIQDSVDETASTICLYIFDVVIILYFLSFPLTTIVYHPHMKIFGSFSSHSLASTRDVATSMTPRPPRPAPPSRYPAYLASMDGDGEKMKHVDLIDSRQDSASSQDRVTFTTDGRPMASLVDSLDTLEPASLGPIHFHPMPHYTDYQYSDSSASPLSHRSQPSMGQPFQRGARITTTV